MGASGWFYEVTYREDVGSALNDLRADVFGRGEYFRSWEPEGLFAGMNREELLESCLAIADEIADSTESISGFADSVIALRAGGQPTTIEAARFLNLESGTHSILDCERVSDLPEFGVVAPVSDTEQTTLFGSAKPSSELVRSQEEGLFESLSLERWEGRFIIGYQDDRPKSLFFFGISGD
jgi:hypothetical protein